MLSNHSKRNFILLALVYLSALLWIAVPYIFQSTITNGTSLETIGETLVYGALFVVGTQGLDGYIFRKEARSHFTIAVKISAVILFLINQLKFLTSEQRTSLNVDYQVVVGIYMIVTIGELLVLCGRKLMRFENTSNK